MRPLISKSVSILLALFLLAAGASAQTKKSRKKRAARSASQTTAVSKKVTAPDAAKASAPVAVPSPTPTPVSKAQPPDEGQLPPDGVRRITPAEARAAFEKGTAIIVDVRGEDSYKAGHVKGARLIPLTEVEARMNELPRDKMIITYCS